MGRRLGQRLGPVGVSGVYCQSGQECDRTYTSPGFPGILAEFMFDDNISTGPQVARLEDKYTGDCTTPG